VNVADASWCLFGLLYSKQYNNRVIRTPEQLHAERETILEQMRQIDRLRRGFLSEQFFEKVQAGKTVRSGPYFVLQCSHKAKKFSTRIPADQAETVRQQVGNYGRFQELAEQFIQLTEELTLVEAQPVASKKTPKNGDRRRTVPRNRGSH